MIDTKTALFNQVLARIGEKRINSADDTGDSATVLRDEYQQCVDQILSYYPWSCATSRAALAQVAGENLTEYEYMFQIPKDVITVQAILDGDSGEELKDTYAREGDRLYCNCENAYLKYTKRIDFKHMDTLMVEALVLLLAHKVAWRITQSVDIENDMYQRYILAVQEASGRDGIEKSKMFATEGKSEWVNAG